MVDHRPFPAYPEEYGSSHACLIESGKRISGPGFVALSIVKRDTVVVQIRETLELENASVTSPVAPYLALVHGRRRRRETSTETLIVYHQPDLATWYVSQPYQTTGADSIRCQLDTGTRQRVAVRAIDFAMLDMRAVNRGKGPGGTMGPREAGRAIASCMLDAGDTSVETNSLPPLLNPAGVLAMTGTSLFENS
ncbi:uncharacterized protein L3040_006910 [Drepanopeziza brunnea f. sp. 'multigermtubi']|uniref:uncharacterized protein n=1 Tax=Drepanopeziza brunnea f. sp. 'multigermtubi' TaxID=698441 RepID=UPI00239B33A1|nr:hypothetical protein L3040_006910 [Drepanopeziza brunnea f. sp. 'multigermtubi']